MPQRAPRPCRNPGCPGNQDCEIHKRTEQADRNDFKRQLDLKRANDPHRKIYKTAAWARTRKAVLERDPLCTIAKKCVERYGTAIASDVVDHIVSPRDGGAEYDTANLRGSCKACHDWRTATEQGFARKKQ